MALSLPSPTVTATVLAEVYVLLLENVAVTVTVVPEAPSDTLAGFVDRLTDGALSSSMIVTVSPVTVRPLDVPDTVAVSSPSTSVSCFGVKMNVPVALVSPAAMVMSRSATAA